MTANGNGRLIDKIVASSPLERRKLFVPEWGADIYFRPLTKAEMDDAIPNDGVERPRSTVGLFLLVHVAEDAQGVRLFERKDIEQLRTRANLAVVNRVEDFMWDTVTPPIKEAEAAILADPISGSA